MLRSLVLIVFVLQLRSADAKRTCLNNCTIGGVIGTPLTVPDGSCSSAVDDYCVSFIDFQYHSNRYSVVFLVSSANLNIRRIYVVPTTDFTYEVTYSCSTHEFCALELAQNKILDLSNRTDSTRRVMNELAPIIEENRPLGVALYCDGDDGNDCSGGVCQIEYDPVLNEQREKECEPDEPVTSVTITDGGDYASLNLQCNRTKCNSLDTLTQLKTIFAKYDLTDANGRIPTENTSSDGC